MALSTNLKKLAVVVVGVAIGSLGITSQALGAVLTFDDLPEHIYNRGTVPNGYGGLNWQNFGYVNPELQAQEIEPILRSGYLYGKVSGENVGYNSGGEPAIVTSGSLFNFTGAYLTGAWRNNLTIAVTGFSGGVQKYETVVTVNASSPTWFDFNYTGIDGLIFNSFGGTDAGYNPPISAGTGQRTHFAIENFTYEFASQSNPQPIPEPSMILGILAFGTFALRWQHKYK